MTMDILCSLKTTIEKFDLTFKTCFPCDVEEHKKISHKLRLICDGPLWWWQNVMGGMDVNGPWEEPFHHILSWFVASKGKVCFYLLRTSHGHRSFGWCSSNHNMWNQVTITKIYIALVKPRRWNNSCEQPKPTFLGWKYAKFHTHKNIELDHLSHVMDGLGIITKVHMEWREEKLYYNFYAQKKNLPWH
jgi:hypothetical protein